MTERVTVEQRDRLRRLSDQRASTIADTLDDALEALRRHQFYRDMADAEATLRSDEGGSVGYTAERAAWLNLDLSQA